MKAYLNDKLVAEGSIHALATGFVCDRIEFDADDAIALRRMAQERPDYAYSWFVQFAGRFKDNRAGGKNCPEYMPERKLNKPAPPELALKEVPPVDRSARVLVSGAPVPEDESHRTLKPNGQQTDYVVLSDAERAKGFVRPVRRAYVHEKCGCATTMSQKLAETYARDPKFYSGTFCVGCGSHFPVGEDGEFKWDDGSKVGA